MIAQWVRQLLQELQSSKSGGQWNFGPIVNLEHDTFQSMYVYSF